MYDGLSPWGPLGELLGEFDPDNCEPDEWEDARDYVLGCILESDHDFDTLPAVWDWLEIFYPDFRGYTNWSLEFPSPFSQPWIPVLDGHPGARMLYERHYSAAKNLKRRRQRKTKLFVGPGEKLVMVTAVCDALFIWRREKYMSAYQHGVNCAAFRNEGSYLSSDLILQAEVFARLNWPSMTRFYTFINPGAVRSSNPGYCFQKAGWHRCGTTGGGLFIYEKRIVPAVASLLM